MKKKITIFYTDGTIETLEADGVKLQDHFYSLLEMDLTHYPPTVTHYPPTVTVTNYLSASNVKRIKIERK